MLPHLVLARYLFRQRPWQGYSTSNVRLALLGQLLMLAGGSPALFSLGQGNWLSLGLLALTAGCWSLIAVVAAAQAYELSQRPDKWTAPFSLSLPPELPPQPAPPTPDHVVTLSPSPDEPIAHDPGGPGGLDAAAGNGAAPAHPRY